MLVLSLAQRQSRTRPRQNGQNFPQEQLNISRLRSQARIVWREQPTGLRWCCQQVPVSLTLLPSKVAPSLTTPDLQEPLGTPELAPMEFVPAVRPQLSQRSASLGPQALQLSKPLPIVPARQVWSV